jgi:hypothetical protein
MSFATAEVQREHGEHEQSGATGLVCDCNTG